MFKKTFTATVAALTLAGGIAVTTQPAEAGPLGRAIAIGTVGFAVGALAASSARPYYRPAYYAPVYGYGCGYIRRPVFNAWGDLVGWRRVPAC